MRTTVELFQLLHDHIEQDSAFKGMCVSISVLYNQDHIITEEYVLLNDYHEEYIRTNYELGYMPFSYWWEMGLKSPRLKWLQFQINKLKENT